MITKHTGELWSIATEDPQVSNRSGTVYVWYNAVGNRLFLDKAPGWELIEGRRINKYFADYELNELLEIRDIMGYGA